MNCSGTGIAKGCHQLAAGSAPHNRVVDHHHPFTREHIGQGIELDPNTRLPHGLGGLDKGAAHIAVFDQSIRKGNATELGITNGSWNPGIGNPNHDVGINGGFTGKGFANSDPIAVERFTKEPAIGAREIDHFEHTQLVGLQAPLAAAGGGITLAEMDNLTGFDVVVKAGANDVEATGFTAHHPLGLIQLTNVAKHQRPDAMAIAQGKQARRGANHQAEGAPTTSCRLANCLVPIQTAIDGALNSKGNQFGIGGGGEFTGDICQLVAQFAGVHQIAVVGQSKGARTGHQNDRLGIANLAAARCGIAVMANGQIARHPLEHGLVKDLAHQAHVLVEPNLVLGIKDRDPGRFLAAVLEGVKTEIGEVCHRLTRSQDGVNTASFLRFVGTLWLIGTLYNHRPVRCPA